MTNDDKPSAGAGQSSNQ